MHKFALLTFFSFILFSSTALACEFCYVKNINCPTSVQPGQEFSINFEFSGTGPDYPYEYVSLFRDGTRIGCVQLNKAACIWNSHSFSTKSPDTPGSYKYTVKCYAADSLSSQNCGMEDDSGSCTVNVVNSYAALGTCDGLNSYVCPTTPGCEWCANIGKCAPIGQCTSDGGTQTCTKHEDCSNDKYCDIFSGECKTLPVCSYTSCTYWNTPPCKCGSKRVTDYDYCCAAKSYSSTSQSACNSQCSIGSCSGYTKCTDCTSQSGCGWCKNLNSCKAGSSGGPSDGSCSGSNWAWSNTQCSSGSDCPSSCPNSCSTGQECGCCEIQPDWSYACKVCPAGKICQGNKCVSDCTNECSPEGKKECYGYTGYEGVKICVKKSNGCLGWSYTDCPYGCSNGQCKPTCQSDLDCSFGKTKCVDYNLWKCVDKGSGCYKWTDQGDCRNWGSGYKCINGACKYQCSTTCTLESRQCSSNGYEVQICKYDSTTQCYFWAWEKTCGTNEQCVNGTCKCNPICVGKTCGASDGCSGICKTGICPSGQTCNDGVCVGGACNPNCEGKHCGGDGCGGNCGICSSPKTCQNGVCVSSTSTCTKHEDCSNDKYCDIFTGQCKPLVACFDTTCESQNTPPCICGNSRILDWKYCCAEKSYSSSGQSDCILACGGTNDKINPLVGTITPNKVIKGTLTLFSADIIDDVGVKSCWYNVDNGPNEYATLSASCGKVCTASWSYTFTDTKSHEMRLTCEDTSGNVGSSIGTVDIIEKDTISPTISSIIPDTTTKNLDTKFTAYIEDNVGVKSCWYNVDNGPNEYATLSASCGKVCTASWGYTFTKGGIYTISLSCNDDNDNIGYIKTIITVNENFNTNPLQECCYKCDGSYSASGCSKGIKLLSDVNPCSNYPKCLSGSDICIYNCVNKGKVGDGRYCGCYETQECKCASDSCTDSGCKVQPPASESYVRIEELSRGEHLITGDKYTIKWESFGIDRICINLWKDNTRSSTIDCIDADKRSLDWIIDKKELGDKYRLQICKKKSGLKIPGSDPCEKDLKENVEDFTDYFYIEGPFSVTVEPNVVFFGAPVKIILNINSKEVNSGKLYAKATVNGLDKKFQFIYEISSKKYITMFDSSILPYNKNVMAYYTVDVSVQYESSSYDIESGFTLKKSTCVPIMINDVNERHKLDLVFVSDSTYNQLDNGPKVFEEDVNKHVNALMEIEPFKSHKNMFNIYRVDVSAIGGSSIPCSLSSDRLMICNNDNVKTIARACPYDKIIVLTNQVLYGGSGQLNGEIAVSSRVFPTMTIHEFGHTLGLLDEYNIDTGFCPLNSPNCVSKGCSKWCKNAITDATGENFACEDNDVGCYSGCGCGGGYRPSECSIMRSLQCDYFNKVSEDYLISQLNKYASV